MCITLNIHDTTDTVRKKISEVVNEVRTQQPLVHCITATVTMSLVADAVLSIGARPMMTETAQEAPVMDTLADALLVNLGTLSNDGVEGIPPTVQGAHERHIPWVLDPPAVGIGPVRSRIARQIMRLQPSVIRANASEVCALHGEQSGRGPDTTRSSVDTVETAIQLSNSTGAAIAMSGKRDIIVQQPTAQSSCTHSPTAPTVWYTDNGIAMMSSITGTGCLLGGLVAACCAVAQPALASLAASVWSGVAAEQASTYAKAPGSLKIGLLDELYTLSSEQIAEYARIGHINM